MFGLWLWGVVGCVAALGVLAYTWWKGRCVIEREPLTQVAADGTRAETARLWTYLTALEDERDRLRERLAEAEKALAECRKVVYAASRWYDVSFNETNRMIVCDAENALLAAVSALSPETREILNE
jgi:hypothetical protein